MLIIIEGVDGSGKSTLAKDISSKIDNATILHRGVPVKHVLEEYETPLYNYAPGSGTSIICDRWHIGPDVYGPIKRNDMGLDAAVRWHINMYLLAKGAYLVYTEMQLEPLLERMRIRGEDYLEEHEVADVVHLYRQAIKKTPLPHMQSITGVHVAWDAIVNGISNENGAMQCGTFKSYVGRRRPGQLYVGNSMTDIAYMPYEGTYANYIISKYGVDNSLSAGFINANEKIDRVWDALYNPTTFALDEMGAEACVEGNIPFTYIEEKSWNL